MSSKINLDYSLHMETSFSVGAGNREVLTANSLVKGADGCLYIPGSTVKGVLRQNCTRFLRTLGGEVCNSPAPARMCFGEDVCPVCTLFGSPSFPSPLIYSDARLSQDYLANREAFLGALAAEGESRLARRFDIQYLARTRVSRARGVAREGALFTLQYADGGFTFNGNITGRVALSPTDDGVCFYELVALLAAIKMTDCIGGGRSSGHGACYVEVNSLRLEENERPDLLENFVNYLEDAEIWLMERGDTL